MRQRIDTLHEWLELQQRDNKQGIPTKIYYKATKDGIKPYKYVRNDNGNKTIIMISEEASK